MTVRGLLSNLDSHEISEWIAYFKSLEIEREQTRKANLEQQIKSALSGKRKKKKK